MPAIFSGLRTLNYLEDTLRRKVVFFTGKGGVGKSTLAWATALACRRTGKKTAVVGWCPTGKEPLPVAAPDISIPWIGLDALVAFREYALQIIRFEKLYDAVLDNKILRTFVLAAPGLADAVMAGKIWDLYHRGEFDLIVVDMPSSGHARSFFRSPLGLQKVFKMGFVARDTERVLALFQSSDSRIDLVCLPEELPLVECRELKESLAPVHPYSFGFLHVNLLLPEWLRTDPSAWGGLSSDCQHLFKDFNQRLQDQAELFPLAQSMGLPQIRTPLFSATTWKENVECTAAHLEVA